MKNAHGLLATLLLSASFGVGCAASNEMGPDGSMRIAASTHMASAGMLERQNNLPGAMKQYEEVIANDPKITAAYHGLGRVHFLLGRFDDSENALSRGLNINKDIPALHNNLGFTYLEEKKYTEAESCFRRALELSPSFKRARMNLGVVLARQGRNTEAIEQFNQVVSREDALFNVSVIRVEADDYAAAGKMLREALFINPGYQPAYDHVDRIERIARTDAAAKAALSRLAAKNAVASFGEPVASASQTRIPTCSIPNGGMNDGTSIESAPVKTVALVEKPAPAVKPESKPVKTEAPTQAARVEPPAKVEPKVAEKPEIKLKVAAIEESKSDEFVGPPCETIIDPECELVEVSSNQGSKDNAPLTDSRNCTNAAPRGPMPLSSMKNAGRETRPVIQPTFTNGVAATDKASAD
ncbi:MAG: tetratricopeptide repeat protein [Planctomycetes bacterium]|nr:tetratricopeptide repeat protein [Planctomycetota bacterium]